MTEPDGHVRVVVRPLASPFSIGFYALAGAALTSAGLDLGWIAAADRAQAGTVILAFTPVAAMLAAVVGFLTRDPVAASGMGVVAVTWAARGLLLVTTPAGSTSPALGTLLLVAAVAILISAAEAATGKLVPAAVMTLTALHFLATALHELGLGAGLRVASGVIGIALVVAALYAAAALALEDLRRRPVLPTGRRGAGRRALSDDLAGQVADVATEAGVRSQL